MTDSAAVELRDVGVVYRSGPQEVVALEHVSLRVAPRTSVAIAGRSGSGKSTLLAVMALLRRPERGAVLLSGTPIDRLSDARLSRLRSQVVGTVFQNYHLELGMTARDNVMVPWYFGVDLSAKDARSRAQRLLGLVGISDLAQRRCDQMSGGQRQRVAIARALFHEPVVLLADEPTGNLDEDTADDVAATLFALPEETGSCVVVVTHDAVIARRADRRLHLVAGRLDGDPP